MGLPRWPHLLSNLELTVETQFLFFSQPQTLCLWGNPKVTHICHLFGEPTSNLGGMPLEPYCRSVPISASSLPVIGPVVHCLRFSLHHSINIEDSSTRAIHVKAGIWTHERDAGSVFEVTGEMALRRASQKSALWVDRVC